MADNLVGYSRAGDEFHYRWAARRCLRMLFPNSKLTSMVIEGSNDVNAAGEYVIDLTEYAVNQKVENIDYYQLKHTTVQKEKPFLLSDLQGTIEGFSKRFVEHDAKGELENKVISFILVTNRALADNFKNNLAAIANGTAVEKRFLSTIKKYTSLDNGNLQKFCSSIRIEDGHGNYQEQKNELRVELTRILYDANPNLQVENITALVRERIMPNSKGKIVKEDILQRFGVSSERELYPAEPIWEELTKTIPRSQHTELSSEIHNSKNSIIIYAEGGVGKSVFTRQFIENIPEGSVGIGYDCFGAGKYRNPSETRHRHKEAMVQISNELATMGLCEPLIPSNNTSSERELTRMFLYRLENAVKNLRKAFSTATLTLLVDAADNAEMAAKEFNQSCFARELLREEMPEGCKLVYLCRPERIYLLEPQSTIKLLELKPFSENESSAYLKTRFPSATDADGLEFHRLTSGNPRVQSNALDNRSESVVALLNSLGPKPTSVEDQIEAQLGFAVSRLKDLLPTVFQQEIDAICTGLASLSPNIPINVLALASGVPEQSVRSFVADIGRPLWLSDSSVQFRDEPTETWFCKTFRGNVSDFANYITKLEPLADHSAYVSEILPQLYHQAGHYDKLINIALSDELLPHNNPIDARNVKVYRLQFAFKAALTANRISDAIRLAMRAGEEVAGDERQILLLRENIDLLSLLQSKEKNQSIAFKRTLSGNWMGSENIYSASLLSLFPQYHGEARGYLRTSLNWLAIYFEESKKRKRHDHEEMLEDRDVVQIAVAKLNLDGIDSCTEFLNRLKPKQSVFRIVRELSRNLVDKGAFDVLDGLLDSWKQQPYYTIAISSELHKVGHIPPAKIIKSCLTRLNNPKTRIKLPENNNELLKSELLDFLECCIYRGLDNSSILGVLNYYYPLRAERMVLDDHFYSSRTLFMRVLAIRSGLNSCISPEIQEIMPEDLVTKKSNYENNRKITDFTQIVEGLLPWYLLRLSVLSSTGLLDNETFEDANTNSKNGLKGRYKGHDTFPQEIAEVHLSIMIFANKMTTYDLEKYFVTYIENSKSLKITSWLSASSASYRLEHLKPFSIRIENYTYELIKSFADQGPAELAGKYISLARAVLVNSKEDASAYFDDAIGIVSKFGDEIVYRWEAVVELAKRTCDAISESQNELSYRFIRIAEIVGEHNREKHWSRGEAIQIATRLSTNGGLAALSRWRERGIGRFEWLHSDMILELLRQEPSKAMRTWSLIPFLRIEQLKFLLERCLSIDTLSQNDKQQILRDTVSRFRKENVSESKWYDLQKCASNNGVVDTELSQVIASLPTTDIKNDNYKEPIFDLEDSVPWDEIFSKIDLLAPAGLVKAKSRFEAFAAKRKLHFGRSSFWKGAISKLSASNMLKFLDAMQLCDFTEHYDFQIVFGNLPKEWLGTAGFKKNYPSVVKSIGRKYCEKLTNRYRYDHFLESIPQHPDVELYLKSGILEGLATGAEFADAEVFFGFVRNGSAMISTDEAKSALDYSMSRFEMHIDADFNEGPWTEYLKTDGETDYGIAGYLWSALSSPFRETRWNSVLTIHRLAKFGHREIFKYFFKWLAFEKIGPYGIKSYPFYNLHARQYLLIAFARISFDNPEFLSDYSDIFAKYAIEEKHILIQIAAANSAKNIERAFPGTYPNEIADRINKVGIPITTREEQYDFKIDSYWHLNGSVPSDIDFYGAWDFDRYWFAPLGRIFGVSEKQVQELVGNVVVNEWKFVDSGYYKDPRVALWNRASRAESTSYSKSSFPKADNLDFYHSYHGLMVVASMLIEKMPVVKSIDWTDERWEHWIEQQYLTVSNGKFLSEYRDNLPLMRPSWVFTDIEKGWMDQISDDDFISSVILNKDGSPWLNVMGWWTERKNGYAEGYFIKSALVSIETANSLLNALQTCKDTDDFTLPAYHEEDAEVDWEVFSLKGWLYQKEITKGIDQFDNFANELMFPPISIGERFKDEMQLQTSDDKKFYTPHDTDEIVAMNEIWVSEVIREDEQAEQSGQRLSCTVDFLRSICKRYRSALIFKIQIERSHYSRYGSSSDNYGYKPPKHKIILFTEDGEIRHTTGSYRIG
ncbi:hypothetical protein [Sphingobacterium siyangense]|uniref:hypothetical protein n=1 Tax=Sphingobacterium siyangense TaxID=459529 RepID=UPI003DA5D802